jgi:hypothetical protein
MNDVEKATIKIQSWFRGSQIRISRLPNFMYVIQQFLQLQSFCFSNQNEDGRINSCLDETEITKILENKFGDRIMKQKKKRWWYDILALDYKYGWIPINIKTSTTLTSDNTSNLAMCVYAYTDEVMDLYNTNYNNGKMSNILFNKLKNKKYNKNNKKDYYFLVLNKTNPKDIIVNSVKGLRVLTPNINNLPFQVYWNENRKFEYGHVSKKVKLFVDSLKKPKPSWKETFMTNVRKNL